MATPTPDPFSNPHTPSPMGPPDTSLFGPSGKSGPVGDPSKFQQLAPSESKNMQLWLKFLGKGATPEQVQKFQANFLNAITQQFKQEAQKSRERMKQNFRMAEGKE